MKTELKGEDSPKVRGRVSLIRDSCPRLAGTPTGKPEVNMLPFSPPSGDVSESCLSTKQRREKKKNKQANKEICPCQMSFLNYWPAFANIYSSKGIITGVGQETSSDEFGLKIPKHSASKHTAEANPNHLLGQTLSTQVSGALYK